MIIYFADRGQNILGLASNDIGSKFQIKNDSKDSDVETGTQTLSFDLYFDSMDRSEAEDLAYVGNYVLRYNKRYSAYEAYVIIDTDLDSVNRTINVYAEGAELDLLNDILPEYENSEDPDERYYATIEKWAESALGSSSFVVGLCESQEELDLDFSSETALSRLQGLAKTFGLDLVFTYDIENMQIISRKVNFVIKRGEDNDTTLRIDREIKNIRVKKSVANLATAIRAVGSVPDGNLGVYQTQDSSGKRYYCWIKFADDSKGKNMEDSPGSHNYVGFCWHQESVVEVEDPKYYTWYRYKYKNVYFVYPTNDSNGYEYREKSSSNKTQYMWIKWAESEKGTNMTNVPNENSKYIGTATKKSESTMSNKPEDYTWAKYSGADTEDLYIVQGYDTSMQGGRYGWIQFSENEDGSNPVQRATAATKYAGIQLAYYQAPESTNYLDYYWDEIEENGNELVDGRFVKFPFHYTGFKEAGLNTYTWMMGSNEELTEFSDDPGKTYLCIRFGADKVMPSMNQGDYQFCKISGDNRKTTLAGYTYDDGNYYTKGELLVSRSAMTEWSRYIVDGGEIVKQIEYDIPYQGELLDAALKDLKQYEHPEVNYEVELYYHPENFNVGDRINIVDQEGKLYVSARVLKMTESDDNDTVSITIGEYLLKDSGITDELHNLANDFKNFSRLRPRYTWIVYAMDENGTDITTENENFPWMGILENQTTSTPDLSDPSIYTWTKIIGEDGYDGSLIAVSSNEPTAGPNDTFIFNKTDFPAEYQNSIKVGDVVFAGDYRYVVQSIEGSVITCGQKADLKGADGQDGYSPTVNIVENGNRSRVITITDVVGDHSTNVKDGSTMWISYTEPSPNKSWTSIPYRYILNANDLEDDGPTKVNGRDLVFANGYHYTVMSIVYMSGEKILFLDNKTKYSGSDADVDTIAESDIDAIIYGGIGD